MNKIKCFSFYRDDTQSDTSSSVSQTSYDPSRPNDRVSELPDSVADDSDGGGVALLSAKPTASAKGRDSSLTSVDILFTT